MLLRLAFRLATQLSPRLAWKAAHLWVSNGKKAMKAYRERLARGELFPPFLFLALTNECNLHCQGCWIESHGEPQRLSMEDVDGIITAGKAQSCYFYTLLGGEPFLHPDLWQILERHSDCYFQIITNGMFLDDETVARLHRLGNVTVLVSVDGFEAVNDQRRGNGVFQAAMEGMARMKRKGLLFGVATTVTSPNFDEVTSDAYVRQVIDAGAMYLWHYVYRPVGANPTPEYSLEREQIVELRRRLLRLRRAHPIILIDTYWDAQGQAVCPAALGLGFHIGPQGSIEPCPPLSFMCEKIQDRWRDLFRTIDSSEFLRGFQQFVRLRTQGCVILEYPQELADFLRQMSAIDTSGRNALAELEASKPRNSHHLPGEEIPEDHWLYRMLKRNLFFGMGGYG